jgi:hypothetical protein
MWRAANPVPMVEISGFEPRERKLRIWDSAVDGRGYDGLF